MRNKKPLLQKILKDVFVGDEEINLEYGSCHREIASESIMDGDYNSALYHVREVLYETLKPEKIPNEDFVGLRFYNIDNCLDVILAQIKRRQLCLGKINFNDALDPLLSVFCERKMKKSNGHNRKKWYEGMSSSVGHFRMACLCEAYDKGEDSILNQLMWAHYANMHTGIAVKYRIKRENQYLDENKQEFCYLKPIRYRNVRVGLDNMSLNQSLGLKSKVWSYEKERRMIFYSVEKVEDYHPIKNVAIEAVYLGLKVNRKNERKIKGALKDIGIPLYKMRFDNKDLMNIKPYPCWPKKL